MSTYTRNMTEGSELKHILFFTLPLLAGNHFQQLYNIVDSAIVGKVLGADALGSVGSTGSATFLFYNRPPRKLPKRCLTCLFCVVLCQISLKYIQYSCGNLTLHNAKNPASFSISPVPEEV